jgi:hypothetical protein
LSLGSASSLIVLSPANTIPDWFDGRNIVYVFCNKIIIILQKAKDKQFSANYRRFKNLGILIAHWASPA